jgi:glycosyltransferase involved in cell wall biosynthesis
MRTISVAMATYNGAKHLGEQLASIESQTRLPDEIVITDDMSSDGTWDILVEFKNRSSLDVHLHQNEARLGYGANFMKAASLCTSDLISFCDQDDIWAADKIERCIAVFDDPSILLCHHDAFIMRGEPVEADSIGNEGLERNPVQSNMMRRLWGCPRGFTQVFRSSLNHFSSLREGTIDHNSASHAPMAHDQWMYFLATSLGATKFLDEKLAYYRQHSENVFGLDKASERRHLTSQAGNGLSEFSRRSKAAVARSSTLQRVTETLDTTDPRFDVKQAASIADLYHKVAALYSRRAMAYGDADKATALKALTKNLVEGWYIGWKTPRLGPAPMMKDILFAARRAISYR